MIIFESKEIYNNSQTTLKPANPARPISWSTYPETPRRLRFEKTANISGYHRVEAVSNERSHHCGAIVRTNCTISLRFRADSLVRGCAPLSP